MELGRLVAPADLRADSLVEVLRDRTVLALRPSSALGWFEGTSLVAWDPSETVVPDSARIAGELLERTLDARRPELVAVLLTYEGRASLARFDGALVLAEDGWYEWGCVPADVDQVVAEARAVTKPHRPPAGAPLIDADWDMAGRDYRSKVRATQERIARGDVYVLNLTARLSGTLAASPTACFSALCDRAASPMSAWFGGLPRSPHWIASVSPERFLALTVGTDGRRVVEVCPIKGTRPRGHAPDDDAALAAELRADAKERAEHVMIVDLERNDLGVVCEPGSIVVSPFYEVTSTPYCHQLVSCVRGLMRSEEGVADLLDAAFPCGSVTGAPKSAALRIAAELETGPRHAYCGGLLVAMPGRLDSSVLIRTLEDSGDQRACWGAGAGITSDSDPGAEWLETLLKATPASGDQVPTLALRETMRVQAGVVPLLDHHLARLVQGGCGPTLLAAVRAEVERGLSAAQPHADGRLSITVTTDGAVIGGFSVEPSSLAVEGGVRLVTVEVTAPPRLPAGGAKPAARAYWDRAHRRACARGGDQAAIVSPDGLVLDGSTATIWIVSAGRMATPESPPAVAGVAREVVFDLAEQLGIASEARQVSLAELDAADEVFLSNAYGGLAVVRGRGGPVSDSLSLAFEAEMMRRAPDGPAAD